MREPIVEGTAEIPVAHAERPINHTELSDSIMRANSRPADFRVELTHRSPPLAPPHSWLRITRVGPRAEGSVELQVDPGAPRAPTWTQLFPLYDTHLDWLFGAFDRLQLFSTRWRERRDTPVGGGGASLLVVANRSRLVLPSYVTDDLQARAQSARDAVDALVPPRALDQLESRRLAYVRSRRG